MEAKMKSSRRLTASAEQALGSKAWIKKSKNFEIPKFKCSMIWNRARTDSRSPNCSEADFQALLGHTAARVAGTSSYGLPRNGLLSENAPQLNKCNSIRNQHTSLLFSYIQT